MAGELTLVNSFRLSNSRLNENVDFAACYEVAANCAIGECLDEWSRLPDCLTVLFTLMNAIRNPSCETYTRGAWKCLGVMWHEVSGVAGGVSEANELSGVVSYLSVIVGVGWRWREFQYNALQIFFVRNLEQTLLLTAGPIASTLALNTPALVLTRDGKSRKDSLLQISLLNPYRRPPHFKLMLCTLLHPANLPSTKT